MEYSARHTLCYTHVVVDMNFRKSETVEANRRCEQHHRIQKAIDQIPTIIGESKKLTHNRQKLTKIADRDEDGWQVNNTSDKADVLADLIGMKKRSSKSEGRSLSGNKSKTREQTSPRPSAFSW